MAQVLLKVAYLLLFFSTAWAAALLDGRARDNPTISSSGKGALSNAQRFARGLPPNRPKKLYRSSGLSKAYSRAISGTGILVAVSPSDNTTIIGYVGPTQGDTQYGIVSSIDGATVFTIGSDSPSDMTATVNALNYPYFGASNGFGSSYNNFGPGQPDYAFILGIATSTGAGSRPQGGIAVSSGGTNPTISSETTIWTVDAAGLLHALWVNPDGSTDPMDIVTFNYETDNPYQSLFITGDVQAWEDRYSLQATSVRLRFEIV